MTVQDRTTCYRYDSQMTMEEDVMFTQEENTYVDQTSYLLGGRGIEMITARRMDGPTPAGLDLPRSSFPIYDGHGNMIATLAKNGTSFTLANEKKYDVWGAVRSASGAGTHIVNPNKQYCANLGHTWDGESGLIYMRARYYEPNTGRFISEDPAYDGSNWYIYCLNQPSLKVDPSGMNYVDLLLQSMESLKNNVTAGNGARLAGGWGRDRIMEATAYHMGRLIGIATALEIGVDGRDNIMSMSNDGNLRIRFKKGTDVQFDLKSTHVGHAHVDLRGALGKYEGWFKSQFGTRGIPINEFAQGFYDGFF